MDEIPNASNVNFAAGQTVPNLVLVSPGTTADSNGYYDIGLLNAGSGSTDLVLDVFGYFSRD